MYTILTTKNGEQLSAIHVSNSEVAGIYALNEVVQGYLGHGYRVMIENAKARKYILVSPRETIAVQLVTESALDLRNAALAVSSADEDTTPIAAIKEATNS